MYGIAAITTIMYYSPLYPLPSTSYPLLSELPKEKTDPKPFNSLPTIA